MQDLVSNQHAVVWPAVIFIAWLSTELLARFVKIPRASCYVLIGFCCANQQLGLLPELDNSAIILILNIALGLILFEFGYRINLHWLLRNPLIIITSLVESSACFVLSFVACKLFGIQTLNAFEFAALAMATSPVVTMYMVNQQKSSGQVTEWIIHLTALNCILAVFFFKLTFGYLVFQQSGSLWQSLWASSLVLILSVLLGAAAAFILALILKYINSITNDRTLAFAIAVILIVAMAEAMNLSALLATLTFGLASRHRLIAIGKIQRNFGVLGELLTILIFIATPSFLNWHNLKSGLGLALLLILARVIGKVIPLIFFSRYNGSTWRKGALTGMGLLPLSVFPIIMLDPGKYSGVNLGNEMAAFSAVILIFDLVGPFILKVALSLAKESI